MKIYLTDYGFGELENIFLSIVSMEYDFYSTIYPDRFNYVYCSKADKQKLLGNPTYRKRLPRLIDSGAIKEINIKENPKNHHQFLKGYIPLVSSSTSEIIDAPTYVEQFFQKSYTGLSPEAQYIYKTMERSFININDSELIEALMASQERHNNKNPEYLVKNFNNYKKQINAFNNNVYLPISEDAFGNRVHSFITTLPKEIRISYVYIDDMPVVEIDLHQSQMIIFGKILADYYGKNSFSEFVKNKDIYLHFAKANNITDRNKAKKLVFKAVFGKLSSKESLMFKQAFPDSFGFIKKIKRIQLPQNPSFKKYSNLSFMLQRVESYVFRIIWKKLQDENIPFLTVHDSIMVPYPYLDKTRNIMHSTLQHHLGDHISLNITMNDMIEYDKHKIWIPFSTIRGRV